MGCGGMLLICGLRGGRILGGSGFAGKGDFLKICEEVWFLIRRTGFGVEWEI